MPLFRAFIIRESLVAHTFQPGDKVIWAKGVGGGFHFPVSATVVAVTPRRVTIEAFDPDEKGEGLVTRHVKPESLLPQQEGPAKSHRRRQGARRNSAHQLPPPADSFEARYPHVASWVQDGWIEIGRNDYSTSLARAFDIGGQVWEGEGPYASLDEALRALDKGIAAWLEQNE